MVQTRKNLPILQISMFCEEQVKKYKKSTTQKLLIVLHQNVFSPRIFPCLPLLCESFANNANLFGTLISSAAAICIFAQHAIYTALVSFKCFHSSQCSPSSLANWYIEQPTFWQFTYNFETFDKFEYFWQLWQCWQFFLTIYNLNVLTILTIVTVLIFFTIFEYFFTIFE